MRYGFCFIIIVAMASVCSADVNNLSDYYGFEEIEIIKLNWGVRSLKIADLNGDGLNDIAVVNNQKAKIELLIQQTEMSEDKEWVEVDVNDIDINQLSPMSRFKKEHLPISQKIGAMVCGDLNSDGLVDIAFYGEPRGLYVLLQEKADGKKGDDKQKLNWRPRKKIKIDDGQMSENALVCADLNNDGRSDLVLAGDEAIYLIAQKDDGGLAEPVKYSTTAKTLGADVGDLNGDGINDLVLVSNDSEKPLHVRFGLGSGQLGPQRQFFIEKPYRLKLYDYDGAAGNEVLVIDQKSGRLLAYKFADAKDGDADWPIMFYPLAIEKEKQRSDLAVGDFNGDKFDDVVISDAGAAELIFYEQVKKSGLAEAVKFPAFADIKSLAAADIDGDGRDELCVLSVKEKVIGVSDFKDERLTFPEPLDVEGEPLAMGLGDVDGNGKIDCVYISKDANDARGLNVLSNVSSKKPKDKKIYSKLVLEKLSSNPEGLRILDVDQDGLSDVLIFVKYDKPILVRQVKKGQFEVVDSPKAQLSLIKDATMSSIAVADIDGKKGEELLVAQNNFARSLIFKDGKNFSVVDQYNAKSSESNVSAVAAFDVGGDKRVEILLVDGQKGQLQILSCGDDKTYRFSKELEISQWSLKKVLAASLTGDRKKNILLFDGDKFALVVPKDEGALPFYLQQKFSYETKIKDGLYGNMTIGDINLDGRADIVMVEYKRNHIEILGLDKNFSPQPAMRFKVFEQKQYRSDRGGGRAVVEPRYLDVADVTGDGKDDLVTIIHDRIIIYPQD